ncbi:MAG: recombinase family protein [Enhydrobacter sp.]|nr:MAG: recombinase family protein [Enhydrobacter sp.]
MKKYVGYVRVSTVKQGQLGSSLQEQRDAILAFSKRHDLGVVEWFEDRETAAKKGRTQFLRMMAMLEKGNAQGVILHKIDRGARNLWDWARLQDLIDAGVEVHFAHDNLDLKSRGGRLAADIQAVVAADYVRNLRDEVRKGMRGRLKQGLYPWKAPTGYLDQGKARPKTIDPVKGPLVRAAFELYATKRFSYHTLALELQRKGLRANSGKPLALHTMTRILRNPFYVGIIRLERTGEVFQGIHEPLVEARVFQRVQDIIDGRENVRSAHHVFAFRRLLTCGLCKYALTGERQKGHVYYRCHTRGCRTTGIREEAVDAILRGIVSGIPFSQSDLQEMDPYIERDEQLSKEQQAAAVASLRLRIAAIQDRERRLTDAYLDANIDQNAYHERRATLLSELAQARDELKDAEAGCNPISDRIRKFFELLRTAQLGPESGSEEEFRETVQIMTSNRSLIGEELSIEPRSPFKEIIRDAELLFGAPHRNELRTVGATESPMRVGVDRHDHSLAAERFRILCAHLRGWEGGGFSN